MQQAPRETHKEIKGQPVNGAPVNNLYDNALIASLSEPLGRKSLHADYCITSLTKEASQLVLFEFGFPLLAYCLQGYLKVAARGSTEGAKPLLSGSGVSPVFIRSGWADGE